MEYKYGSIQDHVESQSLLEDATEEQFHKFISGVAEEFLARNIELSTETLNTRKEYLERLWKYRGNTYNLFEVFIDSYFEIAAMYREKMLTTDESDNSRFAALTQLHAKSVLVLREVQALLESGFPDGAMARWRTLHELAVFSSIIESSSEAADIYLLSESINNAKSARIYSEHLSSDNYQPYTSEELAEINRLEAESIELLDGLDANVENFWAIPYLRTKGYSGRPTFYQLEKHTNMSQFRPYYRLACEKVHAPSNLNYGSLATADNENVGFVVKPSHYGHEVPIEMAVTSSMITFSYFINLAKSTVDSCVFLHLMNITKEKLVQSAFSDPNGNDLSKER